MRNKRVLLVEDDLISLKIYKKLLSNWGYDVHYANDGHLALQMIEEQEYDLLITDNNLPFMSGLELAKRILAQQPHVGLLILSGSEINWKDEKLCSALMKPVMPDFLKLQVERALKNQLLKRPA